MYSLQTAVSNVVIHLCYVSEAPVCECVCMCSNPGFPMMKFLRQVTCLPWRQFPGGRRAAGGAHQLKAALQSSLPDCSEPPRPTALAGQLLSHGLGVSVSFADEHLQKPQLGLYVLVLIVLFSHGGAVFLLDISSGNKGKGAEDYLLPLLDDTVHQANTASSRGNCMITL